MQLKNLIVVFSLAASSVSSVLGAAAPVSDDYESLKSCVSGNLKSCPDFRQFYSDVAQYEKHEQSLKNCFHGNKDACKEWKDGRPEGLKQYYKKLDEHVITAKKEKFDIVGTLRNAVKKFVEKFKSKHDVTRRSVNARLNRRDLSEILEKLALIPLVAGFIPFYLLAGIHCSLKKVFWDNAKTWDAHSGPCGIIN